MYLEFQYYPWVTFQYHFQEDTDQPSMVTFGHYDLTGVDGISMLANVSSYEYYGVVTDSEWALQVSDSNWGYYPNVKNFSNDVAIIGSSYDYIHMPADYYQEVENSLTRQGFACA